MDITDEVSIKLRTVKGPVKGKTAPCKGAVVRALAARMSQFFRLSSKIFVVQRAPALKNGVEFRQKSIDAFRCSLATSYVDWRRRMTSMKLTGTDRRTD